MAEIAVIVPTRSRPQNMWPLYQAMMETNALHIVDLIFVCDQDDMQADAYKQVLSRMNGTKVLWAKEWEPLVPKLNKAATATAQTRQVIMFMGDDHLPRTPNWAQLLYQDHLFGEPKIVYGRDGFQDEKLPTWWSMDSRLIRDLGKMVPAPVQHLYCDNAVMELGQATGRLLYDERILVEHMHPFAGKAQTDDQYVRINRRQQYDRDSAAFHAWMKDGLAQDASLIGSIGG